MSKQKSQEDLDEIEKYTIGHYDEHAQSYWLGTKDHDVSQNIDAFLQAMPKNKALDILDLGCGPGRDVYTFKSLGHNPIGLDGSKEFCLIAQKYSSCPILHQSFLNLDLAKNSFDGIFANASLFHIPSQELPKVLCHLHQALRPNGILFSSNPRGDAEGWQGQRYGHFMEYETSESYLNNAGFQIVHHYYRPSEQPRERQPWLAIVSQRKS